MFQECSFVNLQDIMELVFHHMECNQPRRMSVMDYFGENAWTVFKTDQRGLWLQTILK